MFPFFRYHPFFLDAGLLNQGAPANTHWANLGYWRDKYDYPAAAEALALRLGQAANLTPQTKLLDVSIGYGEQLQLWRRQFGVQSMVGLDITPPHLAVARQKLQSVEAELPPLLSLASATALPFARRPRFDVVLSLDSAYHFQPQTAFFRQAWQVLRPGGCLALTDLALAKSHHPSGSTLSQLGRLGHIPPGNLRSPQAYVALLEKTGFADVAVQFLDAGVWPGFAAFGWRHARRFICRRLHLGWGKLLATSFLSAVLARWGGLHYLCVTAFRPEN